MRLFGGRERSEDAEEPLEASVPDKPRRVNARDERREVTTQDQADDAGEIKPSRMRPPEMGWGYLTAAVLAISALIVLTSPGVGHRAHPAGYELSYVGLAAAIAAVGLIRLRNRVILVAVVFLSNILISYAQLPRSLSLVHTVGLVVPLGYAFWVLWFRYRADQKKMLAARSRDRANAARAARATGTTSGPGRGRNKKEPKILPSGRPVPSASRRYTPPSGKRSERRA